MNRKKIPKSQFYNDVGRKGVALVGFNANWSTPCVHQLPIIDHLSKQFNQKATVRVIDIDENRDLASSFHITSIPTLIILKNGKEIERYIGLQSSETLAIALEKALK